MKENQKAQGARPIVVLAILAMPLLLIVLLFLLAHRPAKHTEQKPVVSMQEPASRPVLHSGSAAMTVAPIATSVVVSKTEKALNKCGLSMKNPIRLAVRAEARPPIIIQSQSVKVQ